MKDLDELLIAGRRGQDDEFSGNLSRATYAEKELDKLVSLNVRPRSRTPRRSLSRARARARGLQ